MLNPVTSEAVWLSALSQTPEWQAPRKRTVVLSPHPDDETLGTGGLIAAQCRDGLETLVVAVTDGEAAYPDSPGLGEQLAKQRQDEQERALGALGLKADRIVRLRLPDSGVRQCEDELLRMIEPLVDCDTLLLAPWTQDPHPDHEATGRVARLLADRCKAELLGYFFWSWHRLEPTALTGLSLVRFGLDEDLQARRAAALASYESQTAREKGEPILPGLLLAPARRPFETYTLHD